MQLGLAPTSLFCLHLNVQYRSWHLRNAVVPFPAGGLQMIRVIRRFLEHVVGTPVTSDQQQHKTVFRVFRAFRACRKLAGRILQT